MIEETEYLWGYVISTENGNWDSDTIHVYQSYDHPDREIWVTDVSRNPPEIFMTNWNDQTKTVRSVGKVSYWKRNIKKENNNVTFY